MKVLVTGSEGFVGTWLMRHLEACGDDAIGLGSRIDITDAGALAEAVVAARADAIIHLAALASVGDTWKDPAAAFSVNAAGALNLTQAALACASPPRVLLISSAEVYGVVAPSELPLREDRPVQPVSPYALSKACAELAGRQAWLGSGLEVIVARPFNHTGPGQAPGFVVPSMARQVAEAVRSGAPHLLVGDVSVRRDLTDVRDVVRAYRLLVEHGEPGETYNVCRGRSTEIAEVARRLIRYAGVDLPLVVDPERLRPVDLPDLVGDPTRLCLATGWVPQIDFDVTLADVLVSCLAD